MLKLSKVTNQWMDDRHMQVRVLMVGDQHDQNTQIRLQFEMVQVPHSTMWTVVSDQKTPCSLLASILVPGQPWTVLCTIPKKKDWFFHILGNHRRNDQKNTGWFDDFEQVRQTIRAHQVTLEEFVNQELPGFIGNNGEATQMDYHSLDSSEVSKAVYDAVARRSRLKTDPATAKKLATLQATHWHSVVDRHGQLVVMIPVDHNGHNKHGVNMRPMALRLYSRNGVVENSRLEDVKKGDVGEPHHLITQTMLSRGYMRSKRSPFMFEVSRKVDPEQMCLWNQQGN